MLVAKKEENYSYMNSNIDNKNIRSNRSNRKKDNKGKVKNKFKLLAIALILLCICLFILLRYTYITQLRFEVSELESQKAELEKEKQDLKVKLEEAKSYQNIEERAIKQLGMNYPTKEQIVYVSVGEDLPTTMEESSSEVEVLGYFKNLVNFILNLF